MHKTNSSHFKNTDGSNVSHLDSARCDGHYIIKTVFSIFFLLYSVLKLSAQMPDTEVWLYKIETDKTGAYLLKNGMNISNRPGYDNQPSFSGDGKKIYYVSVREDKQADIYCYDLNNKMTTRVTRSKESEYSPVSVDYGKFICTVEVEADSAQRIHYIDPLTGVDEKKLEFDSVGYYCVLNPDTVVYYKLTEPHSLRFYSKSTKEDTWLADKPIRGFKAVNRHTLLYGIKDSVKVEFYTYDFLLSKAKKYCEYPSVNEDTWWHTKWGLLKSEEATIMRYDENSSKWQILFDLKNFGIKKISRVAFDPNNAYLVIVNNL